MKKIELKIWLSILCVLLPLCTVAASTMLKARLDSTVILMGKTVSLRMELVQEKPVKGYFVNDQVDTLNAMVEIAGRPKADTIDLGNNRIQINKTYLVQAFDSGQWHINPIMFIAGNDTVRSNELVLKVLPLKVNPNADIKDFAPVIDPERHFLDWVPDFVTHLWWLWLLLLIAGVATWAYFKWWRKGKNPLKREKRRLPPYEEALKRLQLLKAQQLWQNGQEKDYYTALTDILREYIDRRFAINAVEMTSSQILDSLHRYAETCMVNDRLSEILAIADFVKFAGQHPLADDNERAFQRALQFVEATKPQVASPAGEGRKEEQAQ